jgi:hypothetical protein
MVGHFLTFRLLPKLWPLSSVDLMPSYPWFGKFVGPVIGLLAFTGQVLHLVSDNTRGALTVS